MSLRWRLAPTAQLSAQYVKRGNRSAMPNGQIYEGVAAEMLGQLRRLSAFTGHSPSVGRHHEEILKAAIGQMLSARHSIRTGFAYAPDGTVSQQGDLLSIIKALAISFTYAEKFFLHDFSTKWFLNFNFPKRSAYSQYHAVCFLTFTQCIHGLNIFLDPLMIDFIGRLVFLLKRLS